MVSMFNPMMNDVNPGNHPKIQHSQSESIVKIRLSYNELGLFWLDSVS